MGEEVYLATPATVVLGQGIIPVGEYTEARVNEQTLRRPCCLPDILSHTSQNDLAWGFWHYRPDYYIYLPDFDWTIASINSDPRFDQEYHAVASLPGPDKAEFIIFKRSDLK